MIEDATVSMMANLVRQQSAISAVAKLHSPFGIKNYCGHCSNMGVKIVLWPCETISTLATELELDPTGIC